MHARDEAGVLHCRRCMFDESVPPAISPSDRPAVDPFAVDDSWHDARPRRKIGFIVIAIVIVIIGLFVFRAI